jgi:hypothetical protein
VDITDLLDVRSFPNVPSRGARRHGNPHPSTQGVCRLRSAPTRQPAPSGREPQPGPRTATHPHPQPSVNPPLHCPWRPHHWLSQRRVGSSPNSADDGSCLDLGLYRRRSARRERRVVAAHHTDHCG